VIWIQQHLQLFVRGFGLFVDIENGDLQQQLADFIAAINSNEWLHFPYADADADADANNLAKSTAEASAPADSRRETTCASEDKIKKCLRVFVYIWRELRGRGWGYVNVAVVAGDA
jgi:hypothetical protein